MNTPLNCGCIFFRQPRSPPPKLQCEPSVSMQRAQEFCVFEKKVPARWTSYKKAEAQSMGRLPVSLCKAKLSRSFLKEA